MAESAATGLIKGLDVGTSRIVLATPSGDKVKFEEQLNAFVALPYTRMTEGMLRREGILHRVEDGEIIAYGNRVDEFANLVNGDTRRPMQTGLINPSEPKSLEMMELVLRELVGEGRKGDKLSFSVPSAPPGHESDLIYHEGAIRQFLEQLGYEVMSVNEGLAVVYSELEGSGFTGIGMSFGGGMCNICVAYLGLPVLTFCTVRAGDYIDHSAASVTGETPVTVRMHKESDFSLKGQSAISMDQALALYYNDVVRNVVETLEDELGRTKKLPKLTKPIPLVFAGGTAQARGFQPLLEKAISKASLPVGIAEVRLATNPLDTTAKGALVAAMLNM